MFLYYGRCKEIMLDLFENFHKKRIGVEDIYNMLFYCFEFDKKWKKRCINLFIEQFVKEKLICKIYI